MCFVNWKINCTKSLRKFDASETCVLSRQVRQIHPSEGFESGEGAHPIRGCQMHRHQQSRALSLPMSATSTVPTLPVAHLEERHCHTQDVRRCSTQELLGQGASQQRSPILWRRPLLPCLLSLGGRGGGQPLGVGAAPPLFPSSPWLAGGTPLCPARHCVLHTVTCSIST